MFHVLQPLAILSVSMYSNYTLQQTQQRAAGLHPQREQSWKLALFPYPVGYFKTGVACVSVQGGFVQIHVLEDVLCT